MQFQAAIECNLRVTNSNYIDALSFALTLCINNQRFQYVYIPHTKLIFGNINVLMFRKLLVSFSGKRCASILECNPITFC